MMCSSNAYQFINQILSDNNCENRRCNRCGSVAGTRTNSCGCNYGCNSNSNGCSCGCNNNSNDCGCGCNNNSNDCGCGCDDDNDSCDCAQAITNRLLYEILNELRAISECLCGCNG